MYDTLIMLKPEASFTVDQLYALVMEVVASGEATVERDVEAIRITADSATLNIDWNDDAHVVVESNEIAAEFGVPSQGCPARFEMAGDDPDMDLFNDYLIISEKLQATGKFVIFDTQEGRLLFN
ncbi:hypothetical protein [Alloalcanivorax xenomutans]|uniref:hypothetical protein n=1 Tax=Alloalcanivorax xenomutans TaxID=1094342 RepID=UPI003C53E18A